jgi:hypothetical protein
VVGHTYGSESEPITFYHPAVQCACMFLGEFLCIIPFLWQQWKLARKQAASSAAHTRTQRQRLIYTHATSATDPLLGPRHPQGIDMSPPRLVPTAQLGSRGSMFSSHATERTGLEDVSHSVFVLAVPTLCDATSSLLMNVGLFYTSASIFQMLRGLVVFWAGAHRLPLHSTSF